MSYQMVIILSLFFLFTVAVLCLYRYSFLFFGFWALKAGLDRHLTQILEKIVYKSETKPPSKIFSNAFLLDSLLRREFQYIEVDFEKSEAEKDDYRLSLYKIKQVLDLGDHSAYRIITTKDLPLFLEMFILSTKMRVQAKIVLKGKKSFSLLVRLNAENERTYAYLLSIVEGNFLDMVFSGGVMEEYYFSAKVTMLMRPDRDYLYMELAHTKEVNSIFYRRYREEEVENIDAAFCMIPNTGTASLTALAMSDELLSCHVVSVCMAGCILLLDKPIEEGARIALTFSVNEKENVYLGRLGKCTRKDEEEDDGYFVSVQFTQSTKVGLSNLGELVYKFRGS